MEEKYIIQNQNIDLAIETLCQIDSTLRNSDSRKIDIELMGDLLKNHKIKECKVVGSCLVCNTHNTSIQINYDRARTRLIQISGSDKLINIIEAESGDYDRRMAFIETTITELLAGADYSQCETIEDMSKVYSGSVLRRLGF